MLRHSQLQRLQGNPTAGSPLSCDSQTTSSTLSDLIPSSNLRVVCPHPQDGISREHASLPTAHRPRERTRTPASYEVPALSTPASLEIGDLSRSEVWWRDRYNDIKSSGYTLRPRYHPRWQPSWRLSGKDSCEAEDGQHCQVRVIRSTLPFLNAPRSHMPQLTRRVSTMVDRSCSRNIYPKRRLTSYLSFECSLLPDSGMIPIIIAYRCSMKLTYPPMTGNYSSCRSFVVSITPCFKHTENLWPSSHKFARLYPTSYVCHVKRILMQLLLRVFNLCTSKTWRIGETIPSL